jgi:hypothetical protein
MKLSEVTNYRGASITVRPDADETVVCMFAAACGNDAVSNVPNPILGDVPACQKHVEFYERNA